MSTALNELDLKKIGVSGINLALQDLPKNTNQRHWLVKNPMGQHAMSKSTATSVSIAAA
jgi:methylamine---glutamate N-methyltransferase subunit B